MGVSFVVVCSIVQHYPTPRQDGAESVFAVWAVCEAAMALVLAVVGGGTPDELDQSKATELEFLHPPRSGHSSGSTRMVCL